MQIFIYGGSGSGKSALAEKLMQELSPLRDKYYIATMWPEGEEAKERIRRHQTMRAGKGFTTIEQYTGLDGLTLPAGCAVLLECLGNLVANELFAPKGAGRGAAPAVLNGIAALRKRAEHLIIVSNNVGGDGAGYPPQTKAYQLLLSELNCVLCAESDVAVEMVCGMPVFLKGESLCPSCAR